jgi:hypothetical protein
MNGFLNKNLKSYAKNWLSPVKYAEMKSKNAVRNLYTNLYAYAANNPIYYTDPDGRTVDYALIGQLEGNALEGYVPYNGEGRGSNSGVTIAIGFDLGQQNQWDLRRIFGRGNTNQDLKDLFTPYLGMRGVDAYVYVQNNPLVLTNEQVDRVNTCVLPAYLTSISDHYNSHISSDCPAQSELGLF